MATKLLATILVIGSLSPAHVNTYAAEPHAPHQDVQLSPDLLNLLRAEMREIAGGVQGIALSLATADWKSIQETSEKIRASYIMEKKLTPAQAKELEQALPEQFKQLDAQFHQRAERLGMAAAAHDPELVAFQYSRLVESCALCHSAYATSRFPGFAPPVPQPHHH
ncbi:MAG: cytochrome c [Granulosicoccaceae bacterium]|jgi:cytochrome c556